MSRGKVYRLWDTFFVMLFTSNGRYYEKICRMNRRKKSMKGYTTSAGYMGWVEGRYILFASECEYREYIEE